VPANIRNFLPGIIFTTQTSSGRERRIENSLIIYKYYKWSLHIEMNIGKKAQKNGEQLCFATK
jgi:hypothetical protein